MIIYIDLEQTIIDNFTTWNYLPDKVDKLCEILGEEDICAVIFSYAIWSEENLKVLSQRRDDLGKITMIGAVTTSEMYEIVKSHMWALKTHTDVWGIHKEDLFTRYIQNTFNEGDFILYDDTVEDKTIEINNRITIQFIRA